MKNYLQDAISFLQGEADQILEFKNNEEKFAEYIDRMEFSEDYDLRTYLDNTWAFINDQVSFRRRYDKQFADYILDLIDAYYLGRSAYVENDVEAESLLLAEALNYVADKLEGGIK